MKSKTKKIAAIIVAIIVVLVIAGTLLLMFAPWEYKDTEDSVITNIKALQKLDGYLYVYGEEISEISILEDYKDAPYQKIESITSALKSSTHTQNCLVISDVDGTVCLSEDDYSYIYTLVYKYDWWLMYIGTDETHITQLLKHKLALEDAEKKCWIHIKKFAIR